MGKRLKVDKRLEFKWLIFKELNFMKVKVQNLVTKICNASTGHIKQQNMFDLSAKRNKSINNNMKFPTPAVSFLVWWSMKLWVPKRVIIFVLCSSLQSNFHNKSFHNFEYVGKITLHRYLQRSVASNGIPNFITQLHTIHFIV